MTMPVDENVQPRSTQHRSISLHLFNVPYDNVLDHRFLTGYHALRAAPLMAATNTSPTLSWYAGRHPPHRFETPELVTIAVDGSLDDPGSSASENSCTPSVNPPDQSPVSQCLAPLASDSFREELRLKGYVKRPASRPSKSSICSIFAGRDIFPRVLGRRQGRKVAEYLMAEQLAAGSPGVDPHQSASVTLRTPRSGGLKSLWANTNLSAVDIPSVPDPHPSEQRPSTPVGRATPRAPDGSESPWMYSSLFTTEIPSGPDPILPQERPSSIGCVTPRTPQADGLGSPCVHSTVSAMENPGTPDSRPSKDHLAIPLGSATPQADDLELPWLYASLFPTESPGGPVANSTSVACVPPRTPQTSESPWLHRSLFLPETPNEAVAHFSEGLSLPSIACVTPQSSQTDSLKSPWVYPALFAADTPDGPVARPSEGQPSPLESPSTDSAFESFDLHEFSYLTAFTTPPSSPSIVLDAALKKGADIGDSNHAA